MDPSNVKIDIEMDFVNGLEVAGITKDKVNAKTVYTVQTQQGDIQIQTEYYEQVIREQHTLQSGQYINENDRGEISFSKIPGKR